MIARFICGENTVRKLQNAVLKWRNSGAIAAVGCVVAAVSMCFSDDCDIYLQ